MRHRKLIERLGDLATSYDDADMSSDHATITEAITALEAHEWTPIADAPQNGKPILVAWDEKWTPEMAHWDLGVRAWVKWVWQRHPTDPTGENTPDILDPQPLVFMPLPNPPTKGGDA